MKQENSELGKKVLTDGLDQYLQYFVFILLDSQVREIDIIHCTVPLLIWTRFLKIQFTKLIFELDFLLTYFKIDFYCLCSLQKSIADQHNAYPRTSTTLLYLIQILRFYLFFPPSYVVTKLTYSHRSFMSKYS